MITHALRVREYEVDVTGAPATEGYTSGLNRTFVSPESMSVWETFDKHPTLRAKITGRHIKANGQPGQVYVTVTVFLSDEGGRGVIGAPQWVRDLHAEVVASW